MLYELATGRATSSPLNWRTDEGTVPSFEWFAENGYYRVIDEGVVYNHRIEAIERTEDFIVDHETKTAKRVYNVVPLSREEINKRIDACRDQRIQSGFMFDGKRFQNKPEDQKRINGAGSLALAAIISGNGQPGNLRWHGGDADFVWIADDNSLVPMDAPTVIAFGAACAEWERKHIFAAKVLKTANPVPADYDLDTYWPNEGATE